MALVLRYLADELTQYSEELAVGGGCGGEGVVGGWLGTGGGMACSVWDGLPVWLEVTGN